MHHIPLLLVPNLHAEQIRSCTEAFPLTLLPGMQMKGSRSHLAQLEIGQSVYSAETMQIYHS